MNTIRKSFLHAGAIASALLSTTATQAQVPFRYLVTAESGAAPDGFRFVDPDTGVVTEVSELVGGVLGGAKTVSVSDADPNGLYTSAGFSFGGAPLWRLQMSGNRYDYSNSTSVVPFFGSLGRVHASSQGVLFTSRSFAGLYSMDSVGGQITSLLSMDDAYDIAVIGDKVYVNSFVSGQPSEVREYDLTSGTSRTVASNLPTVISLGTYNGLLLVGREDGDVDMLDPDTGALGMFLPLGHGPVIAIAEIPGVDVCFATANNEVYSVSSYQSPIYVSPYTLEDIDIGTLDQPSQLLYGNGCAGSNGTPTMSYTGGPGVGSNYAIEVVGAEPLATCAALLGFTRTDIDLGLLGFPGCALLNEGTLSFPTAADATGTALVTVAIPNDPAAVGAHLMSQFFIVESGSTANLVSSNGTEAIVR